MPDLPAGYSNPLPEHRPVGLRRSQLPAGRELWRIEATQPDGWTWEGFPEPRYRFDPASGTFRTRYAARTIAGAARERYRDVGLYVPADHKDHHLVRLVPERDLRVFDLRVQRNLDVLHVDDQINTGQHGSVWHTCHDLADAAYRWWPDLDAIVYRSRTTPATSANVAFFAAEAFAVEAWSLEDRPDILTDLVLRHDLTVGWALGY